MLVLSRRSKDKISFPQVGITVHFIRVQSGHAKVGIDAPREIAIMRDEVNDDGAAAEFVRRQLSRLPRQIRHGIRNELHQVSVGLHLYKELIQAGLEQEAQETFKSLTEAIARLDSNEALQRPDAKPNDIIDQASIILIEDNANEREMLAGLLRLRGYQVNCFCNGAEAIDHLDGSDPPGVVLVDMKMPKLNGTDTVNALRRKEKFDNTFIFAISGTSPQDNGLLIGHKCVDRWFPKPLNPEFVISAIEQAIGQNSIGPPITEKDNHVPQCASGTL